MGDGRPSESGLTSRVTTIAALVGGGGGGGLGGLLRQPATMIASRHSAGKHSVARYNPGRWTARNRTLGTSLEIFIRRITSPAPRTTPHGAVRSCRRCAPAISGARAVFHTLPRTRRRTTGG